MWDQFRQKYGVYLRLLDAIPADRFASHPIPGMRAPAELAVHVSATVVRDIAEGVAKGRITADEATEADVAAALGGKAAIVAFARRCKAGSIFPRDIEAWVQRVQPHLSLIQATRTR